ncbi:LLM class flavin-dependent oxidoreductase [Gordonia sp. NPDC003376]
MTSVGIETPAGTAESGGVAGSVGHAQRTPGARTQRLALGFNARISFPSGQAAQGLRDGIELFRVAEELGFDTGWVYQRHFDNYLASPLTFLSAVGQHTSRIGLGTAVIAMRYEDPILLAEAAATADLLTDRRLKPAISTGQGDYDRVFGNDVRDGRAEAQRRLARFLEAVGGDVVGHVDSDRAGVPVGTELRVRPHSETLPDRIHYGAGSIEAAERTGRQGLKLLLGTIIHDDAGVGFTEYHARAIAAYHAAYTGTGAPRAGVSRSVLPATTPELARRYRAYDEERRSQGPAASRPSGALPPTGTLPNGLTMSPVNHGEPSRVVDELLADPGLAAADELVVFLPPAFGLRDNLRLLTDIAETVAPQLGWEPPASSTIGDRLE